MNKLRIITMLLLVYICVGIKNETLQKIYYEVSATIHFFKIQRHDGFPRSHP